MVYIYSPKEVLDDKGKFTEDLHTCSPETSSEQHSALLFPRSDLREQPLTTYEAAPTKWVAHFHPKLSLLWETFVHVEDLWASFCNFSFDCKAVVLLLLRKVLLPHHFICCLSKPCVDFRCMCMSRWIQRHFSITRIQLFAANGPSILQTPIAFSEYSLSSSLYWLGLSERDLLSVQSGYHLPVYLFLVFSQFLFQ